jgi:hypothetical protein
LAEFKNAKWLGLQISENMGLMELVGPADDFRTFPLGAEIFEPAFATT